MNVLVVTNMYPTAQRPHFGTFVYDEVAALRRLGAHVDVLFVDGQRHTFNYLLGAGRMLVRSLQPRHYDLVHAHYVFSGALARLQWRWPLVLTLHGSEVVIGWTPRLSRWMARLASWVIVTSPRVLDDLGVAPAHSTVIPCGVDLDLFRPGDAAAARRDLGLAPTRKLVLFAGEPRPEKQVHLLEDAVRRLQQAGHPVDLLIASGLPHAQMPRYMQAADVLGLTSSYEGSPMVVKEAMACNLPIVSTDVGDVAEVIGSTAGCFLAAPQAADIAAKLAQALAFNGRTDGRSRMGRLSADLAAAQVLDVYRRVLQGRK